MPSKLRSDGLGGTFSVSLSLRLGYTKRLSHEKVNLLLFSMILMISCSPNTRNIPAFSLTLAFQRSNELYKNISTPFMRQYFHVPSCNILFCRNAFLLLLVSNLITWLLSLLLQCGDIETNPGPDSGEGSTAEECSVKCVGSDISCFRLYSNISSLILLLLFWDMSMLKSPVMTTSAMLVLHALSTLFLINSK